MASSISLFARIKLPKTVTLFLESVDFNCDLVILFSLKSSPSFFSSAASFICVNVKFVIISARFLKSCGDNPVVSPFVPFSKIKSTFLKFCEFLLNNPGILLDFATIDT